MFGLLGVPFIVGALGYIGYTNPTLLGRKIEGSKEEWLRRFSKARKWLLIGHGLLLIGLIQLLSSYNVENGLLNTTLMAFLGMIFNPFGLVTLAKLLVWRAVVHGVRHKEDKKSDDPNKDDSNLIS